MHACLCTLEHGHTHMHTDMHTHRHANHSHTMPIMQLYPNTPASGGWRLGGSLLCCWVTHLSWYSGRQVAGGQLAVLLGDSSQLVKRAEAGGQLAVLLGDSSCGTHRHMHEYTRPPTNHIHIHMNKHMRTHKHAHTYYALTTCISKTHIHTYTHTHSLTYKSNEPTDQKQKSLKVGSQQAS